MTLTGTKIYSATLAALFALIPLAPSATGQEKVKAIEEYPTSRKIWLGIEDAKIQPANETNYRSSAEGYITFLKRNGETVKKGETWAILDKEQVELEKRSIALERRKVEQSLEALEEEQQEFIEKQETAINKLNTQKDELLASLEADILSANLASRVKQAISEIDEDIAKLKEKIDPEKLEEDLKLSKEELTLSLDKKERTHEKMLRRAHLKSDFDGILSITLDNPNSPDKLNTPIWVELGVTYASITDNSHFELQVGNRNPIFNTHDHSKLSATLDDGHSRQRIKASYKELRKTDMGGTMRDLHIFEFPEEGNEYAAQNSGEIRTIFLYLLLDQDCRVIHKREIALLAPKVLSKEGWPGLVKHLYPGYTLLHIGPKTLAVTKDK